METILTNDDNGEVIINCSDISMIRPMHGCENKTVIFFTRGGMLEINESFRNVVAELQDSK